MPQTVLRPRSMLNGLQPLQVGMGLPAGSPEWLATDSQPVLSVSERSNYCCSQCCLTNLQNTYLVLSYWCFFARCQDTLVHHKDLTGHNMPGFAYRPGSHLPPIRIASGRMTHLPLSINPCPTICPFIAEVSFVRMRFASSLTSSRYVIRMQDCTVWSEIGGIGDITQ